MIIMLVLGNILASYLAASQVACLATAFHNNIGSNQYQSSLKMVNVITRHGDRAPYGSFPPGDKFAQKADAFWPLGIENLTEIGEYRQYKLGIKLRQIYSDYLTTDVSQVLAFSSSSFRCIKSLEKTLQGLFNIEVTRTKWARDAERLMRSCKEKVECPFEEEAYADEWKSINIDTMQIPTLNDAYLEEECAWRQANKSPLDTNGLVDKDVASLPGIDKLADILKSRYNGQLNYANVTEIWAQVLNEMNLAVSRESLRLSDHFLDWASQLVAKDHSKITLYDVSDAASLLLFRDHAVGKALQIQNGPIVTSLVDSFRVALNQSVSSLHEPSSLVTYKDKKMVLYSTHEVVIIFLMNSLELFNFDSSFEDRFDKYSTKSHLEQVINGIRVPTYGVSLKFELVELKNNATGEKLPVVKAYLYDNEDGKFSDIKYHPLKLGKACQKLFKRMYPNQNYSSYSRRFQINAKYICPLAVFEKVTSSQLVNREELVELCKVQ